MHIASNIKASKILTLPEYVIAEYSIENSTGMIAATQVCGAAS